MGSSELIKLVNEIGLSPESAWALPSGGSSLRIHELEVDPYDFLARAEEDYEQGNESAILNAITNAKRAIVSQMDQALLTFGYPATKWKIPKKVEVLQGLGLVAPRILRKVSSARNLLEHEYRRPKKTEVEEAIDLAALFVAAIKPIIQFFGHDSCVGNRSEQVDSFTFARQLSFSMSTSSMFRVQALVDCGPELGPSSGRLVGETSLSCNDQLFPVTVRLAIATDRGFKLEASLADFCRDVFRPQSGSTKNAP